MKNFTVFLTVIALCMMLTACGEQDKENNIAGNGENAVQDVTDGVGDAAQDITEGVGDAAQDVTDGVGDAVQDMTDPVTPDKDHAEDGVIDDNGIEDGVIVGDDSKIGTDVENGEIGTRKKAA